MPSVAYASHGAVEGSAGLGGLAGLPADDYQLVAVTVRVYVGVLHVAGLLNRITLSYAARLRRLNRKHRCINCTDTPFDHLFFKSNCLLIALK